MKKYFVFFAVVASAVILSSCAKVPQVELDAATAALDQAKVAEANLYLESDYQALVDSMNAINAEIEAQKSKMFGSFGDVKEKLAVVTTQASELAGKTEIRKEEIKAEVAQAQAEVEAIIAENNQLAEMAPKGKEGKAAIEAIKLDITAITATAAEVPALLESGSLLAAQTKINAAKQKATEINTELKSVLEKYKR
jgi:hypothetical protein